MSMDGIDLALAEEESDTGCLAQFDCSKLCGAGDVCWIKTASVEVKRGWRIPSLKPKASFGQVQAQKSKLRTSRRESHSGFYLCVYLRRKGYLP